MTMRDELNKCNLNRLDELMSNGCSLGEILTFLLKKATAIESGVTPSSNIATLANIPSAMFQVNATAATTTGIKTLRKGVIGTDVPATGECVWQPGTKRVAFAAVDAVTAASFTYATAADLCSLTGGDL
jgi:hypothetical protein